MGDFQGHPFRGNQWSEGGRVSEGGGTSATTQRGDYRDGGDAGSAPTPDHNPTGKFDARAIRNLREAEAQIGPQDSESADVVTEYGRAVMFKNGEEAQVRFTDEEVAKFEGAILTHNHPSSGPPSTDDVRLLVMRNMREMRVIGRDGTLYRLGRTGRIWDPAMLNEYYRLRDESMGETRRKIDTGKMTSDQANTQWPVEAHEIFMRFAARFADQGVYYKRTRRS